MKQLPDIPVLGFAAYSGTGKTTLLEKILPLLSARGIRAGVIKHAHHTFEIDHEGKDSYRLRKAGAKQVLIGSARRWALMVETEPHRKDSLHELIRHLDHDNLDLILVEGFKPERIPKIELVRPRLGHPLFYPDDSSIIAVASDAELPVITSLPVLNINDAEEVANFIIQYLFQDRLIQPVTGT
ncbi:MAG: molybdopterin-guanine dinucleotide biosynthesis protein MobB [Gammaproteobacteria bacterium]